MFETREMREVNLLVADRDLDKATRAIARLGLLEPMDVSYLGEELPVEQADRRELIRRYADLEKRLDTLIDSTRTKEAAEDEHPKAAPERGVRDLTAQVEALEKEISPVTDRLKGIDQELQRLDRLVEQFALLGPLDIEVEELRALRYLHLAAGLLPAENLERLDTSLFHVSHVILPFRHEDDHVAILAFAPAEQADILDRALRSAYFAPFEIPEDITGPVTEAQKQMRDRQKELTEEKEGLKKNLASAWQKRKGDLLSLRKRVQVDETIAEATEHFARTGHVYLIAGWVPVGSVDRLTAAVDAATERRLITEVNRPESLVAGEATVPSALKNPGILRPFEQITAIFGQPSYYEVDPTPLVALTFFVMFGWMFGDLGHGFLVALTGLVMASGSIKALRGSKGFAPVLIACGLSSMVFGFLYGSVFGVEDLLPAIWLRPLRSILNLLIASIVFGVVAINIGFIFNMINAWRKRNWQRLLFANSGVSGLVMYWAILAFVLRFALHIPVSIFLILIVVAATAILMLAAEPLGNLLAGRRPLISAGLAGYGVEAAFELFETLVAYLSNTLSYVRLGAFAVAHIGLTLIIFIIANLFGGIPIIRWLVIIMGTIGIVAFEGLIVGIQTLRLEYYEFFTRFYSGEGKPYRPLHVPEA